MTFVLKQVFLGETTQSTEIELPLGIYRIQCWGAQGSVGGCGIPGNGSYVAGSIRISTLRKIHIYVGGKGVTGSSVAAYNGGGVSQGGGGGASDVRLIGGEWNNFDSLKSRIIVAGAGGGSDGMSPYPECDNGGSGGTINGFASKLDNGKGGNQTHGGSGDSSGSFGKGGGNGKTGSAGSNDGNGAGGSGYFGGGGSPYSNSYAGGGGSSFVSGCKGCNAIDPLSSNPDNMIPTNQPIHYSGLKFFDIEMIDGNSPMPSPQGGTEIGHQGYGAVIITYLSRLGTHARCQNFNFGFSLFLFIYLYF